MTTIRTASDTSTPPSVEPAAAPAPLPYPEVSTDSAAEAKWRGRVEAELTGLAAGLSRIESAVETLARGGAFYRLASKLIDVVARCGEALVGSPNLKYVAVTLVALAVIVWGGSVQLGDWTINAEPRPGATAPADFQEPMPADAVSPMPADAVSP